MIMTRAILWLGVVFPLILLVSILGGPFYAMCCWAGERKIIEPMVDRVGDRIKNSLIDFANKGGADP